MNAMKVMICMVLKLEESVVLMMFESAVTKPMSNGLTLCMHLLQVQMVTMGVFWLQTRSERSQTPATLWIILPFVRAWSRSLSRLDLTMSL